MNDSNPQSTPESETTNSGQSSNPLDKVKDFLTTGGDKKKWTKVAIVGAAVIVVMGVLGFMVWGIALWAMMNSIGDPSGSAHSSSYGVIKTMEVNITMYSPNLGSNNCDSASGGGGSTADGGKFFFDGGKIKWKKGSKILDHVFAESQDDNIIPWGKIDEQAVVIPGFMNDTPIEVHDHYGANVHRGEGKNNFLDLSYTCGEGNEIVAQLKAVQKKQGVTQSEIGSHEGGITVKVNIVEYNNGVFSGFGPDISGRYYPPMGEMMKKVVSVNRSPHGSAGHGLFWTNGFGLIRGFSFNQSPDGAIDYNFNKPEPVYASFDGKVTKTKYMHRSSYGRGAGVLWITGDDRQTGAIYAHITFAQGIKKGTVVKRGQIIGTIAPKCASSAVDQCVDFRGSIHLHFQFYALDSSNQIRGFTKSELLKLFPIR